MRVELTIAGISCAALAVGHWLVGRWVLPNLTWDRMSGTPLGPPAMTLGMVRFTWHIVTVVLVGFGTLFMTLAWAGDADPKTLVLRWSAALWIAGTATVFWVTRPRARDLVRLPVPVLFVVIAAMSWIAST